MLIEFEHYPLGTPLLLVKSQKPERLMGLFSWKTRRGVRGLGVLNVEGMRTAFGESLNDYREVHSIVRWPNGRGGRKPRPKDWRMFGGLEKYFSQYTPFQPNTEKSMITLYSDYDHKQDVFLIELAGEGKNKTAQVSGPMKILNLAVSAQLTPEKSVIYTQEYWLDDGSKDGKHVIWASDTTPTQALIGKEPFPKGDPQKRESWPYGEEAANEKAQEMLAAAMA